MTAKKVTLKKGDVIQYPQTTDDMVFIEGDPQNKTVRQSLSELGTELSQLGQKAQLDGYAKRVYNLTAGQNDNTHLIRISLKQGESIKFRSSLSNGTASRYIYLLVGTSFTYWTTLSYGEVTTTLPRDIDGILVTIENPSEDSIYTLEIFTGESLNINTDITSINAALAADERYQYDVNNIFALDKCDLSRYISNIKVTFRNLSAYQAMLLPNGCFRRIAFRNINPNNGSIVIYYEDDNGVIDPQLLAISDNSWVTSKVASGTSYLGIDVEITFKQIPATQLYPIAAKNIWSNSILIKGYEDFIKSEFDTFKSADYDVNNVFAYDTCNLSDYISNIRMTFETIDAYKSMLMPNGCFRRFAFRNINPSNGHIVIYYEDDNGIIDPQLVNISGQNWMTTKYAFGIANGIKIEITFKEIPASQLYPIDTKNVWSVSIPMQAYIDLLKWNNGINVELLPANSRLDSLTDTDGETAGLWALRNTEQGQSITKNGDYFTVVLKAGVTNDAFWILDYPVFRELVGKRIDITFKYRSDHAFYFMLGDTSNRITCGATDVWREVVYSKIMIDGYDDGRLMIYDTFQADTTIDLKDFSVKTSFLNERDVVDSRINTLAGRVTALENAAGDINLVMRNFHYKIASIEREENKQCVIGLIGDSWTQHSGASYLTGHSNYVQPLTKYLRSKYGNAGGGFYSFSISHIDDPELQKMGCADPDDATDERSSSGITYQDQVADTKWVDAADAIFGNGTYLTLNVLTAHDKLVIHFWGAADAGTFTYSLDNGTPVSVDASEYTGHSMIEISTTDTTHTLRFDITSGSVMLFGVDMQRTTRGIRVHKFGNKGATSNSFVIADADAWKAGFESLNIDSCTLLMGINEPNSQMTIYNNYLTIIGRIKDVNPYCDICIIQPSGGKLYDLSTQSIYQRNAAIYEDAGFLNLIPLFGSREQITAKGTFMSDGIHPTLDGGRMIADYIEEKIFQ